MSPTPPDASAKSVTSTKKEVDGRELAASLAFTLFELGITLTASYFCSKWIAKMIQGNAAGGPGQDGGMDGFMADNGDEQGGGSRGIIGRLKKLLAARYEATLAAMMEELEDHQLIWKQRQEEKKEHEEEEKIDEEEAHGRTLAKIRTEKQYERLQHELAVQHQKSISTLDSLTPYEMSIAQGNVIDPANLGVTFSDVGGMDEIKSEIYDLVVLPLLRPDLFMSDSGLVSPPKGILLYGPPGTGKTMLAKAIAKESHATFVNVQLSTIMNKWFGESNKLISATFQLARKLAPSVVFIDEMDAFLSQRDGTEGSAVNSMKSEFLTLWDGLLSERKGSAGANDRVNNTDSGDDCRVGLFGKKGTDDADATMENEPPLLPTPPIIVLGATNRPYDVDPAILRRLPRSFEIPLPSLQSRLQLLQLFLEKQSMTEAAHEFLPTVAKRTEGYSGSDLKEVCRAAAWEPVRELTTGASRRAVGCGAGAGNGKEEKSTTIPVLKRTSSGFPPRGTKARPVNENDFLLAIRKVKKTGESARQFRTKEFLRGRDERAATAADISKAGKAKGGIGGTDAPSEEGENPTNEGNQRSQKINKSKNEQMMANLDFQQIMTFAIAAAASMNTVEENTNGHGKKPLSYDNFGLSEEEEADDNDDAPPEISENAEG